MSTIIGLNNTTSFINLVLVCMKNVFIDHTLQEKPAYGALLPLQPGGLSLIMVGVIIEPEIKNRLIGFVQSTDTVLRVAGVSSRNLIFNCF